MTCVYDNKNKNNPDPLFDDWLVQDALEDGDNNSMASPPSPTVTDDKISVDKSSSNSPVPLPASSITTPPSPPVNGQSNSSASGATHSSPALHGLAAALIALMNNKIPPSMTTQQHSAATTPPTTPPSSSVSTMSAKSSKATSSSSTAGTKRKQPQRKPSSSSSSSIDPVDEAAIKRQKNTDAARRSRLKKMLKMESLENKVTELEKVHSDLMMRVAVVDSEKAGLVSKEASYEERIKKLENQLAEAHKALAHKATTSS